ncbi:hypothetical protein D3C81_1106780 [compost metagenome]
MLVRVDMVQRQPGRGEGIELRADLGRQLAPHMRQEEEAAAVQRHGRAEASLRIDQRRDPRARQRGGAVGQHHMQAHAQRWLPARALERIGHGRGAHHQAGRIEHAVAVSHLDGLVDGRMQAEVVGGDDQRALRCIGARWSVGCQDQASCERRKRKNSTPSRRRRFIMSQLPSISRTISQILPGRK